MSVNTLILDHLIYAHCKDIMVILKLSSNNLSCNTSHEHGKEHNIQQKKR